MVMEYVALLCTIGLAVLAVILILSHFKNNVMPSGARLHPGPKGFPLLGNLEFFRRGFHYDKCLEWTRTYGPAFR